MESTFVRKFKVMKRKVLFKYVFGLIFSLAFGSGLYAQNGVGELLAKNRQIVAHEVAQGETLYSLAKLYGSSVQKLRLYNSGIGEDFKIGIGHMVLIPFNDQGDEAYTEQLSTLTKLPLKHTVKPKQTAYRLTKLYPGLSTANLMKWNQLDNSDIGAGTELITGYVYTNSQQAKEKVPVWQAIQADVQERVELKATHESSPQVIKHNPSTVLNPGRPINKQKALQERYDADISGKSAVNTKGAANWFDTENKMMNTTFYALFNDAPSGSIVKVKNESNGKVVYAKVIGSLPENAENAGVLIKLTPAARSVLQNNDAKFRVVVEYYK